MKFGTEIPYTYLIKIRYRPPMENLFFGHFGTNFNMADFSSDRKFYIVKIWTMTPLFKGNFMLVHNFIRIVGSKFIFFEISQF